MPRLRGERDEALAQVTRLTASRDELAGKQGHWKATIARVQGFALFRQMSWALSNSVAALHSCSREFMVAN